MTGRPLASLGLSRAEEEGLRSLTGRRKTAQALALRARIVLACAAGEANQMVAARLGVTPQTVGKWRARFVERRLDGLYDEPRPGVPRSIDDARVEAVVVATLETMPEEPTHWNRCDGDLCTRATKARCRPLAVTGFCARLLTRPLPRGDHSSGQSARADVKGGTARPLRWLDELRKPVTIFLRPLVRIFAMCFGSVKRDVLHHLLRRLGSERSRAGFHPREVLAAVGVSHAVLPLLWGIYCAP